MAHLNQFSINIKTKLCLFFIIMG